jgi:hypothetical protein
MSIGIDSHPRPGKVEPRRLTVPREHLAKLGERLNSLVSATHNSDRTAFRIAATDSVHCRTGPEIRGWHQAMIKAYGLD